MDKEKRQQLYLDLRELNEFAWLGHPLPQERGTYLQTRVCGALRQAVQALSSDPDLPYACDPALLLSHALLQWCMVLTEDPDFSTRPELAEVRKALQWGREEAHQSDRIDRLHRYNSLLQNHLMSLGLMVRGNHPEEAMDILRDIYKMGAELADSTMRIEFAHMVSNQEMVTRAVEWLETVTPDKREWLDDVFKSWLSEGADIAP